jgi:hypothetical protein
MQLCCAVSRSAVLFGAVLAVVAFGLSPSGIAQAAGAGAPPQEPVQEMKPAPESTRAPEMMNSQAINEARPVTTEVEKENWRRRILRVPTKKEGCFTANFPDAEWKEIPCKEPPHKLFLPRRPGNVRVQQVGGSSRIDFSAVGNGPTAGSTGPITEAEGSFDSSNATSECNVQCPNQICPVAPSCLGQPSDAFTLQLNTKPFANTALCLSSPSPSTCVGWEQFVYAQDQNCAGCTGSGFIQYWLEEYGPAGTACPAPAASTAVCNASGGVVSGEWCPFQFSSTGPVYCVANAIGSVAPPTEPIASLAQFKLTADAANGAITSDSVTVWEGTTPLKANGSNLFTDLNTVWTESEFNIFGDGGGSEAILNNTAIVHVRNAIISSGTNGPGCDLQSFTGESNNLDLNTSPPGAPGGTAPMPALLWAQMLPAPSGTPTCADATSVGDTHITTFDGLYYDFQASGDFVMVEAPGFTIHTRQASGAPTWPEAAVNKGIAVQMGPSVVEVDVEPNRLYIGHKLTSLAEGKSVFLPTGVQITLRDGSYIVTDNDGNSVIALPQDNGSMSWINVTVGLGRTPSAEAKGLLGNPTGNAHQLFAANGKMLNEPVSFNDLYQIYGESWRVPAGKSLFTAATRIKPANPTRPFFAADLTPAQSAHAIEVCRAAGITNQELLESCTLDTAVLNNDRAVKVFTLTRAPIHIIRPILVKDLAK